MFSHKLGIMCLCLEMVCLIFVCIHEYQHLVIVVFKVLDEIFQIN
jgi:hypothetical protein